MKLFSEKVTELTKTVGPLIVGLDFQRDFKMPKGDSNKHEVGGRWSNFSSGIMAVVDLTAPYCAGWKPNLAFYEGSVGRQILEDLCWYIKKNYPEKILILDGKVGDIGNTNKQYLEYYKALNADAFTFNPLMGYEDSAEILLSDPDIAGFGLCLTSNKGSKDFLKTFNVGEYNPLFREITEKTLDLDGWNKNSNYHLVVGGTNSAEDIQRVRVNAGDETVFLMPGFGAQDGDYKNALRAGRNSKRYGVLPMVGRAIIQSKLEVGETIEEGIVRMAKYWQEELEDARAAG
jgi:orotidine 5'-phosphate decarboxylase subfamily 2